MTPFVHQVKGRVLSRNGRHLLVLDAEEEDSKLTDHITVRYALVTKGVEELILPALVVDDWGNEIKGVQTFTWIREYGDRFPRAEIFGVDLNGNETQCFLREIDLFVRPRVLAYTSKAAPIADGIFVEAVVVPDPDVVVATRGKRPAEIEAPLRLASVSWWRANPIAEGTKALFTTIFS